tara:strand:+ start:140 stop:475 length:336 start_codon:yes stop_codon:yes gene_type:complete
MAELENIQKIKTHIEKLQKENKNLKELLEEVYEMSMIDDIIDDLCSDRDNDGVLLSHLSLKSQIQEALNLSMTKKSVEKIENELGVKIDRSLHLKGHNGSKTVDHYSKEKK